MAHHPKTERDLLKEIEELKLENQSLKVKYEKDVLERKQSEEILFKLKMAIHNSNEVVFMTNKDGLITFINPQFTKMYGYSESEVVGKETPRILKGGNFTIKDYEQFWNALLNKQNITTQRYVNKCKDGKLIDIEASADPILDDHGNIIGFLAIQRDITERKKREEEIELKNEQLISLIAEKDKFFSIIAHDLRSPFQGFLSLTQYFADESSSYTSEDLAQLSNHIHQSADNLFNLLNNLLEWAQVQKGEMIFEPGEILLSNIITGHVNTLKKRSEQKGISIVNSVDQSTIVFADVNMISSVVLNLLSNAIKFTRRNGTVSISAKKTKDPMIEISISDTGIGIPKDLVDKLFKVGEKSNRKGTDGELSTGLGLLLCKEFVEKNGGKIWVESEEDKGSTFYFTLKTQE